MLYEGTARGLRRGRMSARAHWGALLLSSIATLTVSLIALAPGASARMRSGSGCAYAHSQVASTPRSDLQRAVVCLINRQRVAHGLPGCTRTRRLNRSAQDWTDTMVFDHVFTHGANFSARISAVGFTWSTAGENIATGFQTPAAVVRGWMGSSGHCYNILAPVFAAAGTGVSALGIPGYGNSGTWTVDFALHMGSRAPSGNWGPANGCPY